MIGRTAVVGGGIAGLACARALHAAGVTVAVFEAAAVPGGRVATCVVNGLTFDHGAQFATARDPGFAAELVRLGDAASPWAAASDSRTARWTGVPTMEAIPRALAAPLPDVRTGARVTHLRRGDGWTVGQAGPFDAVALAVPAPEAVALLRDHPLRLAIGHPRAAPCWALLVAFDGHLPGPDVRRWREGPIVWAAREASRPGRAATPDRWVVHADGEWSREHIDAAVDDVVHRLLAAFRSSAETDRPVRHATAYLWPYAKVEAPLGRPCLWDAASGVGACGDWCLGDRVEAAWRSGRALADAMLGRT